MPFQGLSRCLILTLSTLAVFLVYYKPQDFENLYRADLWHMRFDAGFAMGAKAELLKWSLIPLLIIIAWSKPKGGFIFLSLAFGLIWLISYVLSPFQKVSWSGFPGWYDSLPVQIAYLCFGVAGYQYFGRHTKLLSYYVLTIVCCQPGNRTTRPFFDITGLPRASVFR